MSQQDESDPLIDLLIEQVAPIAEEMGETTDHALLVIAVHCPKDDAEGVSSYSIIKGYLGVLAEGLYSEFATEIEGGNRNFFNLVRRIVRDIEADYGLQSEEDESGGSSSIH